MPRMPLALSPLADDGFRQRLALDGDRLIVRVVVVDVEGWVREAGDESSRHQSLIKLGALQWLLLASAGGFAALAPLRGFGPVSLAGQVRYRSAGEAVASDLAIGL